MSEENKIPTNKKSRKPTPKKSFSLDDYKKNKNLDKTVKFKKRKWLPIKNILGNSSFCDATGLKGIPANESIHLLGHTDTGKSTLLLEIAYSCQQNNVLPVFIITEMKFAWEHLKIMGIEYDEIINEETGEVSYEGNFLFIDRSKFDTIEQMGDRINEILDDQRDGKLPMDLCFLIDSIGTLQSDMSFTKNTSNNEWDAGAISRVFGKSLIPRINMCKKETYPHNNYFVVVTQVWVRKPEVYGAMPKIASKGGDTIPFNSTIQVMFGNITNSGTSKLKVKKNGKEVTYATRTKVAILKNHITGISLTTRLVATPHGFIPDSKGDVEAKKYFKENADSFLEILNTTDINSLEYTEENDEIETNYNDDNYDKND
ncbi:MAG: hypothetical protein ACOC22_00990 [bacterium]